jgi:hypothetical protein
MIIKLDSSKLFTVEPAKRFAKEFNVDEKVWIQCWLKYKLLDLNITELCEYVYIKTGRKPSYNSISRWIIRTEIFSRALEARKMGANTVVSTFFGIYEEDVINEISRNMKAGLAKNSRSLV